MLLGVRNWYSELGVTPTLRAGSSATALLLSELAKPFRGAFARVTGSSPAIEVTWPRAVPVRLVGIVGGLASVPFQWTLKIGGSGGAIVASGEFNIFTSDAPLARFRTCAALDLGAAYTGDYLCIEWPGNPGLTLRIDRLWASPALSMTTDGIELFVEDSSVVSSGLTGSEFEIEQWPRRRVRFDTTIGVAEALRAWDGDDNVESFAEAAASLAGADAVAYWERPDNPGSPDFAVSVFGVFEGAPSIRHSTADRWPASFAVREP